MNRHVDGRDRYPRIIRSDHRFSVEFSPAGARDRVFRGAYMVVDLDESSEVLSVEILDLQKHAGPGVLAQLHRLLARAESPLTFSYDDEHDAFSLVLAEGRSRNQRAVDGEIVCDERGHLRAVNVEL